MRRSKDDIFAGVVDLESIQLKLRVCTAAFERRTFRASTTPGDVGGPTSSGLCPPAAAASAQRSDTSSWLWEDLTAADDDVGKVPRLPYSSTEFKPPLHPVISPTPVIP